MRLVWTRRALRHLAEIRSYIERDEPEAARPDSSPQASHLGSPVARKVSGRRLAERILTESEFLAHQPHKGHVGRKAGTREWVIVGSPCSLPYRVQGQTLTILAVLHGAQQR